MHKIPIIKRGYDGGMEFHNGSSKFSFVFLLAFFLFIAAFFCVLSMRLFQLTIVKGEYYKRLSEENRVREVIVEPQRGKIVDRRGTVLAENSPADLQQPGSRLFSKRTYAMPEVFAHLLGYRQAADKNDIAHDDCMTKIKENDSFVDKVGKKGVEKYFECALRGTNGKKLIEMDARGKVVRPLHVIAPINGQTVQLAVDADLQKKAYDLIKSRRAAVVGLKPSTGEVLVLASSPTFNPQAFEDGKNQSISSYFTDETKPMFNRATEGTYPPGSTFKLIVSTGALEEHVITADTEIQDTGYVTAGTLQFKNWAYDKSGKMDGQVNVIKAIKKSNDVYFYKVGEKLGPENIKKWAENFGFDQKSQIGIEESIGTIPSPFWKEEVLKENWYTGDTYNTSIGQGYVLATPLQIARATQTIANNGTICQPALLKNGSEINKDLYDIYGDTNCKKLPISAETLKTVQEGMKEACLTGGTAWPLFDFAVDKKKIALACKTGTAESHAKSGIPYAWFTIYAPVENPEIVLTVLVEEGGEGSDVAAPIAKEVLKTYFGRVQ